MDDWMYPNRRVLMAIMEMAEKDTIRQWVTTVFLSAMRRKLVVN